MTNYYTDKMPIPYMRTQVEMPAIVSYMKQSIEGKEIIRSAYIMFRNESANGRSGINNNYIGAQADSGRWPAKWDAHITGIVRKNEGRTGKERLFIAFDSYQTCIDFLIDRVKSRGLYIGGHCNRIVDMDVTSIDGLCAAYYKSWVEGKAEYVPTESEKSDFTSMYRQAEKIFV